MSSSANQHIYAPRFPPSHQSQSQSQHLPSAWPRGDPYPRQPATLPTMQAPPHRQAAGWPGFILPPPCSRTTTVSPPALPPLAMPITPMASVTPPMTANPATVSTGEASAKRRRRAANPDGELPTFRRRCSQRTSPEPPTTDNAKKPSTAISDAPVDDPAEAARILEERRRRNASASARFRKRRNERERELVNRCVFLEQQLLQIVGSKQFDDLMRKAPSTQMSTGDSESLLGGARRTVVAFSAASSRAPSPRDDDEYVDDVDDELNCCRESGSGISVSKLTAPKSIDDVWSAYLALSQQLAGALQRINALENPSAKNQ